MHKHVMLLAVVCLLGVGCSSSQEEMPPGASEPMESSSGSETVAEPTAGEDTATPASDTATGAEVMAVEPSADKLKAHIADHVTYPATRAQILEACANTHEFSEGEKKWIADHLAEGTYDSSDALIQALGIQ